MQVVATEVGQDKTGRVNPGALCARIVSALHHLAQREAAVTSIDAVTAKWRQAVETTVTALEFQVYAAQDFLSQTLADPQRVLGETVTRVQLINHLTVMVPAFLQHGIQPFSPTFRHAAREFTDAVAFLEARRDAEALNLLRTSLAGFTLRGLRATLEAQLLEVSRQVHQPVSTFNPGPVMMAIAGQADRLTALDTSRMVAFQPGIVRAFLDQTVALLRERQYRAAHDAFANAVVLI